MKFNGPKSPILDSFVPNHSLKRPKQNLFVDQNEWWVEIIEGEKLVENMRCGTGMVTKIVKKQKHLKIFKGVKQKKTYPLKA